MTVEVKLFLYRPEQALRAPGGSAPRISRRMACKGNKVSSLMHRPPLPSRRYICYSLMFDPRAIVRPEGLRQPKISLTPSGIERLQPSASKLYGSTPWIFRQSSRNKKITICWDHVLAPCLFSVRPVIKHQRLHILRIVIKFCIIVL
jgi:hypothetical protein